MIKKNQKGSLLVEMMAVIGLLTLITPILFQQVHRRNEEIISAQIATEMRMIKDGVTAYLEAYEDKIAQVYCGDGALWDSTANNGKGAYINSNGAVPECYDGNDPEIEAELSNYLPGQLLEGDSNIFDEYQIRIYGYTLPTGCDAGGTCEYRPVLYGVIVEGPNSYGDNLRRKVKVASLIGAEGGVVKFGAQGSIQGMHGTWTLGLAHSENDNGVLLEGGTYGQYATAVVTFFNNISSSSILKDVRWQHLDATTVQADLIASDKIAAKNLFTVEGSDNGCIRNFRSKSLTIQDREGSKTGIDEYQCDPFFEVNPETKEVRIKEGRIMTGVGSTRFYCEQLRTKEACQAVGNGCWWYVGAPNALPNSCCMKDSAADKCSNTPQPIEISCRGKGETICNAIPGCSWGPTNGGMVCYSCSDWSSKRDCEEIYGHGCAWLADKKQCVSEFMLDPASTSVVNRVTLTDDIIMSNLNNRRLGAALPNEVLMSSELYCWLAKNSGGVIGVRCDNQNENSSASEPSGGQSYCSDYGKFNPSQFQRYNRDGTTPGGATCHSVFNYRIPHLSGTEAADGASARQGCFKYCYNIAKVIDPNYDSVTNHASADANGDACAWYASSDDQKNMSYPPYAFCSRNLSIYQACRNYCSSSFADEVFGVAGLTEQTLREHVLLVAERACGLLYGKCSVKNLSGDKLPCPDSKNYIYNITPVISSVEANLTAMPNKDYNTTQNQWEFYLGGATMINLQEFCSARPESRSR